MKQLVLITGIILIACVLISCPVSGRSGGA